MNAFKIGCDVGVNGAFALLKNGEIIDIWDMPASTATYGKKNKKEVSPQLLNIMVGEMKSICDGYGGSYTLEANVERVNAFGMGATSAFGFGRSAGVVAGVLAAHNVPIDYVMPMQWKKQFGLIKAGKDATRTLALEKFPANADLFKRKKDVDRADAVFIGLYTPF